MRHYQMAVTPILALALTLGLAGCYPKTKGRDAGAQAIDRALGHSSAPTTAAAPPAQVAGVANAQAGQAAAPGSDDTTLNASDEKLATGQYYDAYPLDMQTGTGIELKINSRGFKPVVILLDTAQQPLSESTAMSQNADGSWTLDVSQQFDQGGRYFVLITAEQVGATGSYTVDAATTTTTPLG